MVQHQLDKLGSAYRTTPCLQMQLQRAEPLPCKNGMSNQCADFFLLQQTTYGFVLGSSHHQEDK